MRAALLATRRPVSVSARRRDVRFSNDAPIRSSKRAIAFDAVAFDRPSSAAARAKEPVSATFANTAQASRSGRCGMEIPETMNFYCFSFAATLPPQGNGRSMTRRDAMIEVRPYDNLGGGSHGWLETRHHFSFADYHDPHRMHWGDLRVWNDDEIAPQNGFPPHPHANM